MQQLLSFFVRLRNIDLFGKIAPLSPHIPNATAISKDTEMAKPPIKKEALAKAGADEIDLALSINSLLSIDADDRFDGIRIDFDIQEGRDIRKKAVEFDFLFQRASTGGLQSLFVVVFNRCH